MHNQNNIIDSQLNSVSAAGAMADNIARTVDQAALRKVRHLVDNVEREERSAQNRAVLLFLVLVPVLAVVFFFTVEHFRKSGYLGNAHQECVARETAKQETALRLDIIRDQPGISAELLLARLNSFRPTIDISVRKSCPKPRR